MKITKVVYGIYYIEYTVIYKKRKNKLVHYQFESHNCNNLIRIIKTEYYYNWDFDNYNLIPTNLRKIFRKYLIKYTELIEAFKCQQ